MKKVNDIYQGLSSQADTIGRRLFSFVHSGLIPVATASERSGSDWYLHRKRNSCCGHWNHMEVKILGYWVLLYKEAATWAKSLTFGLLCKGWHWLGHTQKWSIRGQSILLTKILKWSLKFSKPGSWIYELNERFLSNSYLLEAD